MSSATPPVEIIPAHRDHRSGDRDKVITITPESVITIVRNPHAAANLLKDAGCDVEAMRIPLLEQNNYFDSAILLYGAELGRYVRRFVGNRVAELHSIGKIQPTRIIAPNRYGRRRTRARCIRIQSLWPAANLFVQNPTLANALPCIG
jgi:hypothetical protein